MKDNRMEIADVSTSPVIGTFTGKCCDGDVYNNNDMKLSVELFENLLESEEYKNAIANKYYIGFLGHPDNPNCMDFRNACIVMTDMHLEDNGDVIGSFDLIDTPVGQVVKSFIDAGVKFGISIRGAGDVDADGNVDPETFVFRGFDLVTFPAYDDCVPEFREIAASSDLDKQVKYKKVCATVKKNLKAINSASSLEIIQDQFNENSDEFAEVSERLDEINGEIDEALDREVLEEKVDGLTDLYIETVKERDNLIQELAQASLAQNSLVVQCNRRISSFKRIAAAQIHKLESSVDQYEEDYQRVVTANTKLQREISSLKRSSIQASQQLNSANLKYKQKMQDHSEIIAQKDSAIESLKNKLSETVAASKSLEKKTSNLDGEMQKLSSRVEAAEKMIFEYQQAYADLFANALGVHLEDLSVTASTSVSDLRKMISAGTSTSNMMSGGMLDLDEDESDEDIVLEEFSSSEDGDDSSLVTI